MLAHGHSLAEIEIGYVHILWNDNVSESYRSTTKSRKLFKSGGGRKRENGGWEEGKRFSVCCTC